MTRKRHKYLVMLELLNDSTEGQWKVANLWSRAAGGCRAVFQQGYLGRNLADI